jgi:kynurenine formamidase
MKANIYHLIILNTFLIIFSCTTVEEYEWESGEWIDLTHEFSEETLYWPTSEPFKMDTVFVGTTDAGFYYESYSVCTAEHGGTHLDAPIHFYENRNTVEQIEISRLTGRAVVVNVTDKVEMDRISPVLKM